MVEELNHNSMIDQVSRSQKLAQQVVAQAQLDLEAVKSIPKVVEVARPCLAAKQKAQRCRSQELKSRQYIKATRRR